MTLHARLTSIETAAERRRESALAERLSAATGQSVVEMLHWLAETATERTELERVYRGRRVSVAEITREMAATAGLDEAETEQAIAEAGRVLRRLEEA